MLVDGQYIEKNLYIILIGIHSMGRKASSEYLGITSSHWELL